MIWNRFCLLLFIQFLFRVSRSDTDVSIFALNSNDVSWDVVSEDGKYRGKASVPGGIFTDLFVNGILPEDPLMNQNDLKYRWVSKLGWNYSTTFQLTSDFLQKSNLEIVFHGIDTVSSIFINGQLVGNTDNMFVRYNFNAKPFVSQGLNKITVAIQSPLKYSADKYHEHNKSKGYVIPPVCIPREYQGECHANFIRKMQASYAWDWGPAFPSVGIWKPIEIKAWDSYVITDMKVTPVFHEDSWVIDTEVFVDTSEESLFDVEYRLDGILLSKQKYNPRDHLVKYSKGRYSLKLVHEIPVTFEVDLWWPNNAASVVNTSSGQKVKKFQQKLYKFRINARKTSSSNEVSETSEQTREVKIGFRTIEVVQDPLPGDALSFYFKVNGHPMFMKGSNFIPSAVLPEKMTNEAIDHLLRSAASANMNMLRVWGGGVYESDFFYDLADELGILIWQDFMYACALYPVDAEFLKTVRTEIRQQVRRLQNHPSIALWAGNNENELALEGYWYPEVPLRKEVYENEYRTLYVYTIEQIISEEDKSRPFFASSPSNGLKSVQDNYLSSNPQDIRYGDVHFYDYSSNLWDWTKFPNTKFCSEYGIQGLPSISAWKKALDPNTHSCLAYPVTDCVKGREHQPWGLERVAFEIEQNMDLPSNSPSNPLQAFEYFIYLSQINQAMSIKTETEFYRRNREVDPSTGGGMTYGALYWQLNDVWVGPTWSSIDNYGGYKMLHYYAKEFFAPLILVPFIDRQQNVKVHAVSDFLSPVKITVFVEGYKLDNTSGLSGSTDVIETQIEAGSVTEVFSLPLSEFISKAKCLSKLDCVIRVSFNASSNNNETGLNGENFLLLSPPKDSKRYLVESNVIITSVKKIESSLDYEITLRSNGISLFVWLSIDNDNGIEGTFSRNGFVMFDKELKVIFTSKRAVTAGELQYQLKIQTLN